MKTALLIPVLLIALTFGVSTAYGSGDAAAGESKAASCAGCHGADGKGVEPNPPLLGLEQDFFVEQLQAFKSGARENAMMQMFAGQLSDQDMADLAAYYASLGGE